MERKKPQKKTAELAVTIGPASFGKEQEILKAGATRLRLNASHMVSDVLAEHVVRIRKASASARIVIDLQGSKIRLGAIQPQAVSECSEVTFTRSVDICPTGIHLPHDAFFETISLGDTFSIGDGDMIFSAVRKSGLTVVARALSSGTLLPKKGVTILGHPITDRSVAESNIEKVQAVVKAAGGKGISWALSFVSSSEDITALRPVLPKNAKLIAKIERQTAIDNLNDIASAADAIWICRGDLGEQLGLAGMAKFVGRFDPTKLPIPSVLAGQIFHHMVKEDTPTRAEVCQLFDALARGYKGVVLSDETSIGKSPVATVALVRKLMDNFARG